MLLKGWKSYDSPRCNLQRNRHWAGCQSWKDWSKFWRRLPRSKPPKSGQTFEGKPNWARSRRLISHWVTGLLATLILEEQALQLASRVVPCEFLTRRV